MILVNLLPYHLRPIKRTPVPYLVAGLVWVLAVLAMLANFAARQADISRARAELQNNKVDLQSLQDIVAENNRLVDQKRQLADKITTIDEIVSDRIIWSRQLYNLSRLAPKNLWYESIEVVVRPKSEEVMQYNPTTKKSELKKVTVNKQILVLKGHVLETESVASGVYPFVEATTNDEEFRELFSLEDVKTEQNEVQGVPVTSFELEYIIQKKQETGGSGQ